MDDKRSLTSQLLRAGAPIGEINCLRKHLSGIKGGRLACACAPARLVNLLISDVAGDDPSAIASGPGVSDPTTLVDALRVIEKYRLEVSDAVRRHLSRAENETPKPGIPFRPGSRPRSCRRRSRSSSPPRALTDHGVPPVILSDSMQGEAGVRCPGARGHCQAGRPVWPACAGAVRAAARRGDDRHRPRSGRGGRRRGRRRRWGRRPVGHARRGARRRPGRPDRSPARQRRPLAEALRSTPTSVQQVKTRRHLYRCVARRSRAVLVERQVLGALLCGALLASRESGLRLWTTRIIHTGIKVMPIAMTLADSPGTTTALPRDIPRTAARATPDGSFITPYSDGHLHRDPGPLVEARRHSSGRDAGHAHPSIAQLLAERRGEAAQESFGASVVGDAGEVAPCGDTRYEARCGPTFGQPYPDRNTGLGARVSPRGAASWSRLSPDRRR